jgi:DNA-directed RNA polymerase subunit M/transcription elongation factor TFIIS
MSYRDTAIKILKQMGTTDSEAKLIEKKLYNNCFLECSEPQIENMYSEKLYQIIGDFLSKLNTKEIIKNIDKSLLGWKHPNFKENADRIAEQNDFIQNPFEVEEGVFQCKAVDPVTGKVCGSKRVFSYTKQDRSSDEGTSVYAQCFACKTKWRERG